MFQLPQQKKHSNLQIESTLFWINSLFLAILKTLFFLEFHISILITILLDIFMGTHCFFRTPLSFIFTLMEFLRFLYDFLLLFYFVVFFFWIHSLRARTGKFPHCLCLLIFGISDALCIEFWTLQTQHHNRKAQASFFFSLAVVVDYHFYTLSIFIIIIWRYGLCAFHFIHWLSLFSKAVKWQQNLHYYIEIGCNTALWLWSTVTLTGDAWRIQARALILIRQYRTW